MLSHSQVFLAILYLVQAGNGIIHEKGRCIWMDQCSHDECGYSAHGGFYNTFNNSWAYNVTEESDGEWYNLIEELCPLYVGGCGLWGAGPVLIVYNFYCNSLFCTPIDYLSVCVSSIHLYYLYCSSLLQTIPRRRLMCAVRLTSSGHSEVTSDRPNHSSIDARHVYQTLSSTIAWSPATPTARNSWMQTQTPPKNTSKISPST